MLKIKTMQYPGFESFKNNLSTYMDMFLKGDVIAFRGANCSAKEQQDIMMLLGDELGWWPNSLSPLDAEGYESPFYYETHERSIDRFVANSQDAGKNSLILGWHLEHVAMTTELYLGACWSMNLFKCDSDAGKTLFVDVVDVFNTLSVKDQNFLDGCVVRLIPEGEPDSNNASGNLPYKLLQKHWILGIPIIRTAFNGSHWSELVSYGGRKPTLDECQKLDELLGYIVNEVNTNESIRKVHAWEQGDLLILDVFRLVHAVTGGFVKGERQLDGIFGKMYS